MCGDASHGEGYFTMSNPTWVPTSGFRTGRAGRYRHVDTTFPTPMPPKSIRISQASTVVCVAP